VAEPRESNGADELARVLWSFAGARVALDVADPRYEAMSSLAFARKYAEASAQARAMWCAGVWDVRALGHLLYGHFLARGLAGLPWLLDAVGETFSSRWDDVGPTHKKREHADAALRWLAQSVLRDLQRHEKARDETWAAWHADAGAEVTRRARGQAERALAAVTARLAEGAAVDRLAHLATWLREREAQLDADERAAAERAEAEAAAAAARASAPPADESTPSSAAPARTVEGSAALELLLRKLALFEALIERGDLRKAAVVAHDVQQTLAQFDPLLYLPKLFVRFFTALSRYAPELERPLAELEEPQTRALQRLYQADLDAFDQL